MFGSLTSLTNPTGSDWGERLLNTVASKTIRYLFTQSESVEVFVQCHPSSKLLQGNIDSFKMSDRGLVTEPRVQEDCSCEGDIGKCEGRDSRLIVSVRLYYDNNL